MTFEELQEKYDALLKSYWNLSAMVDAAHKREDTYKDLWINLSNEYYQLMQECKPERYQAMRDQWDLWSKAGIKVIEPQQVYIRTNNFEKTFDFRKK